MPHPVAAGQRGGGAVVVDRPAELLDVEADRGAADAPSTPAGTGFKRPSVLPGSAATLVDGGVVICRPEDSIGAEPTEGDGPPSSGGGEALEHAAAHTAAPARTMWPIGRTANIYSVCAGADPPALLVTDALQ